MEPVIIPASGSYHESLPEKSRFAQYIDEEFKQWFNRKKKQTRQEKFPEGVFLSVRLKLHFLCQKLQ